MATQKALALLTDKKPFQLVNDWQIPKPGPKEVLVKLFSTALNPADWRIQDGAGKAYFKDLPVVSGLDGSGIIEEVGSEVTHLAKGDRVMFAGWFSKERGTFQQYALSPAAYTAKIPNGFSFDQAATVPMCLATVITGIWAHEEKARSARFTPPWEEGGKAKYARDVAFVVGGSSCVGQYAIQCARMQGYGTIIATSSLKHQEFLKSLGATHVIDRNLATSEIQAQAYTLAAGRTISYVYDAIPTRDEQRLGYEVLAEGGTFVTVQPPFLGLEDLEDILTDSKTVVQVNGTFEAPGSEKIGLEVYKRLPEWLAKSALVPNRVEVIPGGLSGIPEGLERLKKGEVSGVKLVVRPAATK